jgi:hypothetical protein
MRADLAGSLAPIPTEDLEYGYLGRNVQPGLVLVSGWGD